MRNFIAQGVVWQISNMYVLDPTAENKYIRDVQTAQRAET